jgi:hypothetical protein
VWLKASHELVDSKHSGTSIEFHFSMLQPLMYKVVLIRMWNA